MLRVALTGGVGSGKSAAAAIFRELGAHVSQSDEIGRAMMQPGGAALAPIAARFGQAVLAQDGSLDRAALARVAFDEGRVEEINAIVHPLVIAAQASWAAEIAARDPLAVAIVESALVFETKYTARGPVVPGDNAPWHTRFDRIVVIVAPLEVRRQRYIRRLGGSISAEAASADFERRAAAQWTDEQKSALADFVMVNDGTLDDLRRQVERLYVELRQESIDSAEEAM